MNSVKILILFIMSMLILSITGCNSREDVSLSSPDQITMYLETVIDEPIQYIRTEEFKEHSSALYIYNIVERNIEFEVEAYILAEKFEEAQLSNYHEYVRVGYEDAIELDPYYVEERIKLAKEYGINDEYTKYNTGEFFCITVKNYDELEEIVEYIKVLDELYSFKEKRPDRIDSVEIMIYSNDFGMIYASKTGGDFEFSKTKNDKIDEKKLLKKLRKMYNFFEEFRGSK